MRVALHSKKNGAGIELISPKIDVAMLSCKRYIGNIKAKPKIGKIIIIQENSVAREHGRYWKVK